MTDTRWPFYPLAFLHDAARCLALAHQEQLRLNAACRLQVGSAQRLAHAMLLEPAVPRPRSEAHAPEMAFLVGLLGQAGLFGAVEGRLRLTATAYEWLALPAALQIQALRQVWWSAPLLGGRWLPSSRRRQRLPESHWRSLIAELCRRIAGLPAGGWTGSVDVCAPPASGFVRPPGEEANLPRVRLARERQAGAASRFMVEFILPVLGLLEMDSRGQPPMIRPTLEGGAWLRAALGQGQPPADPPLQAAVELALPSPGLSFPAPDEALVAVDARLRVTVALAAPAVYTFDLAHFAHLLSAGAPAIYQVTRASLEQALAWGYSPAEIRFLLARFSQPEPARLSGPGQAPQGDKPGERLPPAAAAQLAAWERELMAISYQPGYRLDMAGPATLAALRRREPFRRRAQPLASGQAAWVSQAQAGDLWRYLRRLGYVLVPAAGQSASSDARQRTPWPALRQAVPLAPLLVALRSYALMRRWLPALAKLELADLEEVLAAALSPDDLAAARRLLESHLALLAQRLGPLDEEVGLPSLLPPASGALADLAARLPAAIAAGSVLTITYADAAARVTRRRIHPLRLETHEGQVYLVAWCALRQDERRFRLDRILEWEIED